MSRFIGAIVAIALIVFGLGALFTNTSISTEPNQQGLWYKAGPLTSTHFDECILPGTRKLTGGLSDKTFVYPAGQRNFEFSDNGSADAGTIVALTKDNVELRTSGVVRFELTRDCESLTKFHEEIGLSNVAYFDGEESEGWFPMLNKYLHASLQRAVNEATQEFDWKELYNNVEVKAAWEKKVSELLPRFVQQSMDGEYFENYSLTIQKPALPDDILQALLDTQAAIEQNNAQLQRNNTVETEAQSIQRLVDILGPDGYNTYQAIKDGKITIYPIPQGSGVIVNGAPTVPAQ